MDNRYVLPDLWTDPPSKRPHNIALTVSIIGGMLYWGGTENILGGLAVGICLYIIVRGMLE